MVPKPRINVLILVLINEFKFCGVYRPFIVWMSHTQSMTYVADATYRDLLHEAYLQGNFRLQRLATHIICKRW